MMMVDAYFTNGFNKGEATKTAGFSVLSQQKIWNAPQVKAEVQRRLRMKDSNRTKRETKFNVSEEQIMAEMCKLAFAPVERGFTLVKKAKKDEEGEILTPEIEPLDENAQRFGATVPVAARDKKAALDSLAKMKGMFIEKIELTGDSLEARLLRGQQRLAKGGQNALEE